MLTTAAARTLRVQLVEIPDLCALASEDLEPSGGRSTGLPSGTRTPPLPVREDILTLLGPATAADVHDPYGDQTGPPSVASVLSAWCEVIWGNPCPSIRTAVIILLRCHDQAVTEPYATDYAREIKETHRRLLNIARTYTPPLALRCPQCHKFTLTTDPGRGYRCCDPDCHATLLPDLYDHLADQERSTQLHRNARRDQLQHQHAAATQKNTTTTKPKDRRVKISNDLIDRVARARYLTVQGTTGLSWADQTDATRQFFAEAGRVWLQAAADAGLLTGYAYRAEYDSSPLGTYLTRDAAQDHCQHDLQANVDIEDDRPVWIQEDRDDAVSELNLLGTHYDPTGYAVVPIELLAAFDPGAENADLPAAS